MPPSKWLGVIWVLENPILKQMRPGYCPLFQNSSSPRSSQFPNKIEHNFFFFNLFSEGIRSHIMAVLNERRRMITLGHSYEVRYQTYFSFIILLSQYRSICFLLISQMVIDKTDPSSMRQDSP